MEKEELKILADEVGNGLKIYRLYELAENGEIATNLYLIKTEENIYVLYKGEGIKSKI
jgi:hypothetical protein